MPRILHTADWQIGRLFGRFAPEDAIALAEARLTTIERIASLATQESVDAILVAGDVFDSQTVSDRTIRRTFNAMQGFAGPWILIPGNHDAALAESVWQRARRLGAIAKNIHIALEPRILEFREIGLSVLAAPLTQRQTYSDLTEWFDDADTPADLLRIGLAHGSAQGVLAEDIDSPNPIAGDRAQQARLDYLALGDWHGCKQINERTWYSGTPEQERFKDNESGHVLIVDLPGGGMPPRVQPYATGQYNWQQWREHLVMASDLDQLLERLKTQSPSSVLDLVISGELDLAGHQRLLQELAVAEARYRSVQCDMSNLRLEPTDADIANLHADGYVGEVITELRESQHTESTPSARDALAILASLLRDRQAQGGQA